jgi:hypothetical protein
MAWATLQQVKDVTGKDVTDEALAVASSVITTYAGADDEAPDGTISGRDLRILRRATAWQAIWMPNQPGHLEHRGVDYSPSTDGASSDRRSQADQDLAPLAQRELKNLSWFGTRAVSLRGRRRPPKGALLTDWLNETSDCWSVPGA